MMWERAGLKYYAKQELKISYWTALLVCLVGGLLGAGGVGYGAMGSASDSSNSTRVTRDVTDSFGYGGYSVWALLNLFMMAVLIVAILVTLYSVFVANPLSVGMNRFFIRSPYGQRDFGQLFSGFQDGYYMQYVKVIFMKNLFVFLWSLLFVIPGIIKSYEYRFVPYIIGENPNLTYGEAMDISSRMTYGHKGDMFILDLSFLGWQILASIVIIGHIFLRPYVEATYAQLYFVLRENYQGRGGQNGPTGGAYPGGYAQQP